jgi:hypothetical protein
VAFLEGLAKKDPEFLDKQRAYTSGNETHFTTFRTLLNTLKGQSEAAGTSSARQSQSTDKLLLTGYSVVNPTTLADDGYVGANVPVVASMDVSPRVPPSGTYSATQEMTVHNILPSDFKLNFVKGTSQSFPWAATGSVQSPYATRYNVNTVHTVMNGGLGTTSGQSNDDGNIVNAI